MFLITCKTLGTESSISLEGVDRDNADDVAQILVNNLSFEGSKTPSEILSVTETTSQTQPHFRYVGKEEINLSAEKEMQMRSDLYKKGILTGGVTDISTMTTTLHLFEILNQ